MTDFWQTLTVAHDTYDHLPVHLLLDDSETTCVGVGGGSTADFTIKFTTTAYYQRRTPGITILVSADMISDMMCALHTVIDREEQRWRGRERNRGTERRRKGQRGGKRQVGRPRYVYRENKEEI